MNKQEILDRLAAIKVEERSLRAKLRALEATEKPATKGKQEKVSTQGNEPEKVNKFVRMANAIVNSGR